MTSSARGAAPPFVLPLVFVLALAACGAPPPPGPDTPVLPPPPARPAACRDVAPGELQALLDDPAAGDVLCLRDGRHPGPVVVRRPATIWGAREAVIASNGQGTTLRIDAPGAVLLGFTVDGSGGRFDLQDSAIHVGGEGARVEGLLVKNAQFGILVERTKRVTLRGNEVYGSARGPFGLRGDGIRLWETTDSLVERNSVSGGRDVVVWYSRDNKILGNVVTGGRYGAHLMYSHGSDVEDNRFIGNVVGVFVMYSRNVVIRNNVMAKSHGAAGMGLGIKESGNLTVTDNLFVHDTLGVYIDTSPVQVTESNTFERNVISGAQTGIVFHKSETRNAFLDNTLRDNGTQVRVDGGGDATGVTWRGNDFDDYRGYDFDGDGTGDVPYELVSLSGRLQDTHPDLAFLRGSAALDMIDAASRLLPLLRPKPVLVDPAPRFAPVDRKPSHAR